MENRRVGASKRDRYGLDLSSKKVDLKKGKKKKLGVSTLEEYLAPGLKDSSFGKLTEEVMFEILKNLSLEDMSYFAMASKGASKMVSRYALVKPFIARISHMLRKCNSLSELLEQGIYVGRLLKRTSLLLPVFMRLRFFYEHVEKVKRYLTSESATMIFSPPLETLPFMGTVLHTFILGWDEAECFKVFTFMSEALYLNQSICHFVSNSPGTDIENEIFLRKHLRLIFLDHCGNEYDRATWIGFVSNRIGTAQLAKILLLLYGPTDDNGYVKWNFPFNVRAFQDHATSFITLAKTISILQLVPNWSPTLSLEVLVYISNVPNCWLLRSFSSLLLPLSCVDMSLVVEYFSVLYRSGRASTASLLIALVLMISPHFVNTNWFGVEINRGSVHQFLLKVINNPRITIERYTVVKKLWSAVLSLADDFAETAVQAEAENDSINDFQYLVDAWKDLTVALMSD